MTVPHRARRGWGTGLRRTLGATLLTALVSGAAPSDDAAAQGRSLRLESFHSEIVVRPDGDVVVTETLRPRFTGSWNGLYRVLSLRHRTGNGLPTRLDVEILSVTDGEGNALDVDHETLDAWSRRLQIWVPGAVDATRTVVIRYRVDNAIRFFDGEDDPGGIHDELYWNVTGNEWEIPIDRASAEVTLPPGTTVTEAVAYTGPVGSQARNADVEVDVAFAEVVARDGVAPGEGLTISISFPPGAVPRPGLTARTVEAARMWWPAGLPLLALVVMGRLWTLHGRDPRGRSIAVEYEPPEGLTPAEAGTLVDHRAEMHDLTSTLVDLAVRGWIRIEERTEKRFFGLKKDREYVFHLLRPRSAWGTLLRHEQRFLGALFRGGIGVSATRVLDLGKALGGLLGGRGGKGEGPAARFEALMSRVAEEEGSGRALGDVYATGGARREPSDPEPPDRAESRSDEPLESVDLSDLENRFYKSLGGIKNAIYDRLVERGHYRRRPDQVTGFFVALAIGVAVAGGIGAAVTQSAPFFLANPAALLAGFLASAAVVLFVGLFMPARTVRGARSREAALGFKEFLERVEEPRFRRMIRSPEDFERYLPYAMAFRVEDRWARAFEDLYREPPDWYVGSNPGGGFRASAFTSDLSSMTRTASSSFSSSPSGSSSGSGGGGSSGGGSGGGGGGGF